MGLIEHVQHEFFTTSQQKVPEGVAHLACPLLRDDLQHVFVCHALFSFFQTAQQPRKMIFSCAMCHSFEAMSRLLVSLSFCFHLILLPPQSLIVCMLFKQLNLIPSPLSPPVQCAPGLVLGPLCMSLCSSGIGRCSRTLFCPSKELHSSQH